MSEMDLVVNVTTADTQTYKQGLTYTYRQTYNEQTISRHCVVQQTTSKTLLRAEFKTDA